MTSTFDASTSHPPADDFTADPEVGDANGVGTLDMLGQAVAERIEAEPETVEVPGIPLRLVCSTDIPSKRLSSWQRRALPPQKRNSAQVSPFDLDPAVFNTAVLIGTCQRVEVRRKGGDEHSWRAIAASDGTLLTLADKAVQERLGALDSAGAVKRLFPRDSDLVRAGQQVLDAAGWTEKTMYGVDDEDADPTS